MFGALRILPKSKVNVVNALACKLMPSIEKLARLTRRTASAFGKHPSTNRATSTELGEVATLIGEVSFFLGIIWAIPARCSYPIGVRRSGTGRAELVRVAALIGVVSMLLGIIWAIAARVSDPLRARFSGTGSAVLEFALLIGVASLHLADIRRAAAN